MSILEKIFLENITNQYFLANIINEYYRSIFFTQYLVQILKINICKEVSNEYSLLRGTGNDAENGAGLC